MSFRHLYCLAAFLSSAPGLAQTAALLEGDLSLGARLPPTSAALADEATALAVNPAGLSHVRALSLFYVHERNVLQSHTADGIYLANTLFGIGAGFSMNWVRRPNGPDVRNTGWGLSFGGPEASIGAGLHFFSSHDARAMGGLTALDLGALARPAEWLSLGFVARNLNQPRSGEYVLARQFDAAVGIRPIGDRFTLAVDYLRSPGAEPPPGRLAYTLLSEVLPGLVVSAGASHRIRGGEWGLQFGVTLNERRLGIGYAAGGTSDGLSHVFTVRASANAYRALSDMGGKVVFFDLDDRLVSSPTLLAGLLGFGSEDPYLRLSRLLEQAHRESDVRGVVLKMGSLPRTGPAKAEELRQAVLRLKKSGKKVMLVATGMGDLGLQLASACDRVYALSSSRLLLDGPSASFNFLGGTMAKLGVKWDVARVGAYKNAPDALTRTEMSAEQSESVHAFLDTQLRHYQRSVREGRNISSEVLQQIFAEGLIPSARAVQLGIVDELITPEQLEDKVDEMFPKARFETRYSPSSQRQTQWGPRKKIAIVPVLGTIAAGKSRQGPLGFERIAGAETVARALKQAEWDPTVAAVVLRVDSGGGEVLASELMYRAVVEAKRHKPVVASMGDTAASGGYFAAVGADEIFASPTTLTGSIGVFYLKPALDELAGKLGLRHEIIAKGPLTGLTDPFRPWGPREREVSQRWVDSLYDSFISEVATSRRMAKEQVDLVARGRVWSGEDARSKGLVDGLGGLHDAIAAAKRRAGIDEREEVAWVVMGEPHGLLAAPGGEPGILVQAAEALIGGGEQPSDLASWAADLNLPLTLLSSEGPVARLPFTVKIE